MRDWLSHRAATTPETGALITARDGESWDYDRLDREVERTAGTLAAWGVDRGDHVGVVSEPRREVVVLAHAAMRLGAVFVPLSDRLTTRELGPQIDTADLSVLLCSADTEREAVVAADGTPVASFDSPEAERVEAVGDWSPATCEPASWTRSDRQLLLFTSGTTGTPKAVELTVGNLEASVVSSAFRLGSTPSDRWLVTLPLHHAGGLVPLFRATMYGNPIVLREEFQPGPATDDIGRYDVTGVSLVPTMLSRMLDARGTLPDCLRVVLLGGAPAPERLIERCGDYSIPVHPTYGMTEAASQVATARPGEAFDRADTVGRPLFMTEVAVLDGEGNVLPRGETGELAVSGPTVTRGYYGNPEATRGAFEDGRFRTGDVGYRDEDGYVYVLNRVDDRIITGGENVEPGEVVDVLLGHPGIEDAAVVGVPDPVWGERVGALIVADDLDTAAVEGFCRERLAAYKLPRVVAFTDEIPRTHSGTVDREAARDRLESAAAAPDDGGPFDWPADDRDEAARE